MHSSRSKVSDGDWVCPDENCANVNFARRTSCNRCNKPKVKTKADSIKLCGQKVGKQAASKSGGLFSEEDWICSKCGNVNWARRNQCNMCNNQKFSKVEARTGYGGGYNERGTVEYNERVESDSEYDDFGRKKKKTNSAKTEHIEKKEEKPAVQNDDEEDDDDGDLSKYDLEDDEDDDEDADLSKYALDDSDEESNPPKEKGRSRSKSSSKSRSRSPKSKKRRRPNSSSSSSRSRSRSKSHSRSRSRSSSSSSRSSKSGSKKRSRSRSKSRSRSPRHSRRRSGSRERR